VGRKARADTPRNELDERRVGQDQAVAEILVLGLPVLLPERLGLIRSSHGKRIRRAGADSSGAATDENPSREVGHPYGEGTGGERDHPGDPAVTRRVDRDEEEPGREHNEQEAEKVALHPGSVVTASRTPRTVACHTGTALSPFGAANTTT
jgi:hypothetical protein